MDSFICVFYQYQLQEIWVEYGRIGNPAQIYLMLKLKKGANEIGPNMMAMFLW